MFTFWQDNRCCQRARRNISRFTVHSECPDSKVYVQSWGDHSQDTIGKKCPDAGIIDRLIYVYWTMKDPILDIPSIERALPSSLEEFIIWLRTPYQPDASGRWPHDQQIRYSYMILIIKLAEHYHWLL